MNHNKIGERQLVLERIFDAPRNLVWQAWTDPEQMMRWWGPKSFTCSTYQIDLRVGGRYLFSMRSPEGQDFWGTGEFREVVPFERLVWTDSFADSQGNVVSAAHYGMAADFPLELLVTVTLEEIGDGQTRMVLTHAGLPTGEISDQTAASWNESFDKLSDDL